MSVEAVLTYSVYFRQLHSNEWGSCAHILCLFKTAPQQWVWRLFSHNDLNEAVLNTLFISDSSTAMSEEAVLTYFVYLRQLHNNECGGCSHNHNDLNEAVLNTLFISDSSTAMSEEAVLTYFVYLRQLHNNECGGCSHIMISMKLFSILCLFQTAPQQWVRKLCSHTLFISNSSTAMSEEVVLTYSVYLKQLHSNEWGSCSHILWGARSGRDNSTYAFCCQDTSEILFKNYLLIELKIHILSRKTARVVRFFELNVFLQFKQNFVHTTEDLQKLIAGRGRQPTFIDILKLLRCSSET